MERMERMAERQKNKTRQDGYRCLKEKGKIHPDKRKIRV